MFVSKQYCYFNFYFFLLLINYSWLHLNFIVYFNFILLSLKTLLFYFLLLLNYGCVHFPPSTPPCPNHPCLPLLIRPPLALSTGPWYVFLDDPSPIFPYYLSCSSPLVTVSLFFISMCLVIFCLLVCFVD